MPRSSRPAPVRRAVPARRHPRAGAIALTTLAAALVSVPSASAVNYVSSAGGLSWQIHDAAAPALDTGSVRAITGNAFYGFGNLRVRVNGMAPSDPGIRMNGQMMRGWGLEFDGTDRFTTTTPIVLGGVQMRREVRIATPTDTGRWVDSFANTTDAPITVDVSFGGTTGLQTFSNGAPVTSALTSVVATSDGDTAIEPVDSWAETATSVTDATSTTGTRSPNGPSAVVFGSPAPFSGALAGTGLHQRNPFSTPIPPTGTESNFMGYTNRITLQPGETRTLVHFVVAASGERAASGGAPSTGGVRVAEVADRAKALAAAPDLTGVSTRIRCTIHNFALTALPNAPDCAAETPAPAPEAPAAATPKTTSPYDVVGKTLTQLQADMVSGEATSQQITRAYLDRIAAYDQGQFGFHAFISVADDAMAQAKAADDRRAAGGTGDLLGIPVALKDLYDTKDQVTTAGTLALRGVRPTRDAFQVAKLREAGVVIIGKANLSEFANSGSRSESGWGQVWNAFNPSKSSLGSSGGSGVATATSMAAFAMGSQTGVSLYAPSTGASLVTMRGTDGISSVAGVAPLTFLQDFAGPMAQSVTDLAAILNVTTGTDPEDAATVAADADAKRPADWKTSLDPDALRGKVIGYLPSAFTPGTGGSGTVDAMRAKLDAFRALGATVKEVTNPLPSAPPSTTGGDGTQTAWTDYFARNPNAPFRDAQVLNSPRVLPYNRTNRTFGAVKTPAQIQAQIADRTAYKQRFTTFLDAEGVDALVYPGFKSDVWDNDSGNDTLSSDRGTGVPTSNIGVPTIVVPVGPNPGGDPMSFQIVGRAFDDAKILGFGFALEQQVKGRMIPTTTPRLEYDPGATVPPVEDPKPVPPVTTDPNPVRSPENAAAAPAPAPVAKPKVATVRISLSSRSVRVDSKGRYRVRLACATGTGSCRVKVAVRRGGKTVGTRTVTMKAGGTTVVRLTANATMRRSLKRGSQLKVRVSVTGVRGARTSSPRTATLTLRGPVR